MGKKKLVISVLVAVCVVLAIVLAATQPWNGDAPAADRGQDQTPSETVDQSEEEDGGQEVKRREYEDVPIPGTNDTYRKGIVVVIFKDGSSSKRVKQIVSEMGGAIDSTAGPMVRVRFEGDVDEQALADKFESYDEVESANLSIGYGDALQYNVNDPLVSEQTYLDKSTFRKAWDLKRASKKVTVAVLDTGIDLDHEDLEGQIDNAHAMDFVEGCPLGQSAKDDALGHGTEVAGVIAATANNGKGIAGCSYNAKIMPIRIIGNDGRFHWDDFYEALLYLVEFSDDARPDVVNMSIGKSEATLDATDLRERIQSAITRLRRESNIVFVAASGNLKPSETKADLYKAIYPAAFDGVLGVGALGADGACASFSKRYEEVDLCAPGTGIVTTEAGGGYTAASEDLSGTSFSAPQVAAAAALARAKAPDLSAGGIDKALTRTAAEVTDGDADDDAWQYGSGALDARAALASLTSPSTGEGESDTTFQQRVPAEDIPAALAELHRENPDVVAWVDVPGTNIGLPVCKKADGGAYYLDHDVHGQEESPGCPYVDDACSGGFADDVTVVYGHSASDAEVGFSALLRFAGRGFFDEHDEVRVFLVDGDVLTYRISSAGVMTSSNLVASFLDGTKESLEAYFDALLHPDERCSIHRDLGGLTVGEDKVLQLSTCLVPADPDYRFVVTCVLAKRSQD